jgi:PAS domain S-box-containing protein
MIAGTYNAGLVVLSVLIAILASYAAFNLAERVSASGGKRRWAWLTSGAIAMGFGIWSMHYVGMLAFVVPVPVLYHLPTVILSLFAAVAGAAIALYIVSKKTIRLVDTAIVGACLGGAIVSMHYVGMSAMRSAAMHHYKLGLVILSVAVAVTFSSLAAWLAFRFGKSDQGLTWTKISAASLMGVGIASMHYTAMAAAYFIFVPGYAPLTRDTVEVSTLGALGIGMTTLLLLATTLVTMWFDRRLANERLLQQLYTNLQEREAKIRRLVDSNIIGVLITNLEGQILEANDAFLRMVRYTRDDLTAGRLRWTALTPSEWQAVSQRAEAQLRASGTCEVFEKEYFRSDGTRVPVLVAAAAIAESKTENVAFVLDLTERKRAEEERERLSQLQADLAYMSRVITVGELAASLAHEIKQPIAAAVMNAKVCVRWLRRDAPHIEEACAAAARTVNDVNRAAEILDRVRSLYRRDAPQRENIDLNVVIREMVVLLNDRANQHSVFIRTELDPELPAVSADRVQLQQVLMNLMLNGIEAMKDTSGELTLTSKKIEDGQLLISVSDSGVGLPVEKGEHIFEAFFTTKSQGTGMGLPISRRIIESFGGRLWATANAGSGATFHFTMPVETAASSRSASVG